MEGAIRFNGIWKGDWVRLPLHVLVAEVGSDEPDAKAIWLPRDKLQFKDGIHSGSFSFDLADLFIASPGQKPRIPSSAWISFVRRDWHGSITRVDFGAHQYSPSTIPETADSGMKKRIMLGCMALLIGNASARQTQGKDKGMRDQIEKLLAAYSDLYSTPSQGRIDELETKVAELGFDGIHIGTPDAIDASDSRIPLLSLSGSTLLRAWEVNQRTNATIVAVGIDADRVWFWPLYPSPAKKLKPMPRPAKPTGEAAAAREYGCMHRVVGENTPGGMPAGDYVISILEWDRASNIRAFKILGNPNTPVAKASAPDLPWASWTTDTADFQRGPQSPDLSGDIGLSTIIVGHGSEARVLGSFGVKARKNHLIGSEAVAGKHAKAIRAAVSVEVLQLTLDKSIPEIIRMPVPIHCSQPVHPGDILKGGFALPLANLRKQEETLVYAFLDGQRSGPLRIPPNGNR